MTFILGLAGKRGSGKDTVARLLQELQPERQWRLRSFGDAIKDVCAALAAEPVASYHTQPGKAELLPVFGRTRGELLQQVGLALRRWEPQVWVQAFFAGLPPDAAIIAPDLRFPEEADEIRARGGLVWRLEGDPLGQRGDGTRDDDHPSETALDDYPHYAATIRNTGSPNDLRQQVQALLGR